MLKKFFILAILSNLASASAAELCSKNISIEETMNLISSSVNHLNGESKQYKVKLIIKPNFLEDNKLMCFQLNEFQAKTSKIKGSLEVFSKNGSNKFPLIALVKEMVQVAVPIHTIKKGEKIEKSKLTYINMPKKKIRPGAITEMQKAINYVANKTLMHNLPILDKDLKVKDLVSKNQKVNLYYNNNNISIKALGIALDNGQENDVISVRNLSSNIIVQGKISKDGDISVGLS